MTQTIQGALSKFAGAARPLRTLTKEQLFIYPAADPSTEAGFKFAREVIHRRGVWSDARDAVAAAKERVEEAHLRMVRNAEENKPAYEKQLALRKRELAAAQAEFDALPSNDQALSHDEVQAHYRGKHLAEYQQQIEKWKTLNLFASQQFGWSAFLTCEVEVRRQDVKIFEDVQALAAFCGEDLSHDFREILAMHAYRIAPSMGMRRRFLDEDGQLRTPASLEKEQQKIYWDAWRAYNTATVLHKWPDDSGVAFDERVFKINKNQED